MAITQLQSQVVNHLEFVGYEVNASLDTGTEETQMLRAERSSGGSIDIWLSESTVKFMNGFGLNDFAMANMQGLFEVVNNLNRRCQTQYFIGGVGETGFFYNLWYCGLYEKKAFAQFVSIWEMDIQALAETEIYKFLE